MKNVATYSPIRYLLNFYFRGDIFVLEIEKQVSIDALGVYSGVIEECCLLIIIPCSRKNKSLDNIYKYIYIYIG